MSNPGLSVWAEQSQSPHDQASPRTVPCKAASEQKATCVYDRINPLNAKKLKYVRKMERGLERYNSFKMTHPSPLTTDHCPRLLPAQQYPLAARCYSNFQIIQLAHVSRSRLVPSS